jgi:hypothetical protein
MDLLNRMEKQGYIRKARNEYFNMVIPALYRIYNEVFDGEAFTLFVKHFNSHK